MHVRLLKWTTLLPGFVALVALGTVDGQSIISSSGFSETGEGISLGTYYDTPQYLDDTYEAGELIPVTGDYSQLSLQVALGGCQECTVDFSIAPDVDGAPGQSISTDQLQYYSDRDSAIYTISFLDAAVNAGNWYWITASSNGEWQFGGGEQLPEWWISQDTGAPLLLDHNNGGWQAENESFVYQLDGTQTDSTYIDPGPVPIPVSDVPEPSTLALLGAGLVGLVFSRTQLTSGRLGSTSQPS